MINSIIMYIVQLISNIRHRVVVVVVLISYVVRYAISSNDDDDDVIYIYVTIRCHHEYRFWIHRYASSSVL